MIEASTLVALLAASFRMAPPFLFTGLGELYAEKSGIMNLSVEGLMIVGAFSGFVITDFTENPWLGLLAGVLSAAILSYIFAFLAISLQVDQVVAGIALNLFIFGITSFLYRVIYGVPELLPLAEGAFEEISIPGLSQLPFIGPILFSQCILVYVAFLLVPTLHIIMNRTGLGLKIIACGEHPEAADTRGINVNLIRYLCVIFGGSLAGVGGSFLCIAQYNQFTPGMIAGRGFIAFALVIFGRWSADRIMYGALLFGFAEAVALLFQLLIRIPYQFFMMLPYVVTIAALIAARGRRSEQPSYLGIPYKRAG